MANISDIVSTYATLNSAQVYSVVSKNVILNNFVGF